MKPIWNRRQTNKEQRLERAAALGGPSKKIVAADQVVALLEAVIEPGDRVCLEGDNQKQADFLAAELTQVDPERVHDLHIVQSCLTLPEHLDIFELGIARRVDFSYSGPQAARLSRLIEKNQIEIGGIHTYLELYGRYFLDLTPRVALIVAEAADADGNLYTGPNTEDTPVIVEATAFGQGIVVAQVNRIVEKLPRVDIPGDWVDFVVESPKPFYQQALFTRDPAQISETMILMAMMAIKGIYAEYGVKTLNHGVGFNTAAVELILPTYGESLGLKGKICTHFALNPHPTIIPAIEEGWIETIRTVGGEIGMEAYVAARSDIFPIGVGGTMRSNRAFVQAAGHYACDLFIGASLQVDPQANSSTAIFGRVAGFGGAPNFGCDARGRRHVSPGWLKAGREAERGTHPGAMPRGRKLVVQMMETFREGLQPAFVERLDAWKFMEEGAFELPPVMVYGDDVSHIITEEGIANLLLCRTLEEREQAVRGVAGYTPVGLKRDRRMVENLRDRGIIRRPQDLGIRVSDATRDLLAAQDVRDLVRWSGGLYNPPAQFRNW